MGNSLTIEKYRTLLKGMKAAFPNDWFVPSEDSASIWYRHLNDLPYRALSLGISKIIMTFKKPPTVADIREAALEFIPTEKQLGEQEAWALVRKAVSNSNYHSQEEFDRLPNVIQKAVGAPRNLAEWAVMDIDTFESVQQSQFLRSFRAAETRQREIHLLSPVILDALTETQKNALGIIWQQKVLTEKGEANGNT